jgi:hypothetical protein
LKTNRLIKPFHMLGNIFDVNSGVLGIRMVKQFRNYQLAKPSLACARGIAKTTSIDM